jgi:hypothetical protein
MRAEGSCRWQRPTLVSVATTDDRGDRSGPVRPGVVAGRRSREPRTPVEVAEVDAPSGPPTAEFVMPDIVQAQPSGEVPEVPHTAMPSSGAAPASTVGSSTDVSPELVVQPGRVRQQVVLRSPRRRPRVRRVSRVLRHIDPWSVFKVAAIFSLATYVSVLTSGVLLWRVADSTGTLANIERWFTQFGWETFELKGDDIFSAAWVIGLFVAVGTTGFAVLSATLFNLVSDIVGGVRVSVLEEEVTERTDDPISRFRLRRPGG